MKPSTPARERREARAGAATRRAWIAPCAVVVITLAVSSRALGHAFLTWDDNANVTENPLVRAPSFAHLFQIWREPFAGLYVPLAYTFWAALAWLTGTSTGSDWLALDPTVFHGANIVMHAACAWLLFRVLERIVECDVAAAVGALFFALHPLQVESVAWVSEARGLLSALLSLVALDVWLARARREVRTPQEAVAARSSSRGTLAACALLYMLALLAKPSAAALPLIALVLDRFVIGRPWRRVLPAFAVGVTLALGALALTQLGQSDKVRDAAPLALRPLIAGDALAFYLSKLAWPANLAPDYGRTPAVAMRGSAFAFVWAVPLAIGAILAVLPGRKRSLACFALFVAAVAPVLGLVPFAYQNISTVADRYAYLALIGPALALASWLARRPLRVALATSALVLVPLAAASWVQSGWWRDGKTLFAHTLAVNPASYKAHSQIAIGLVSEGRRDEAMLELEKCIAINPDHELAQYNLGVLLLESSRFDEAARHLSAAVRLKPQDASAQKELGTVRLRQGRAAEAEACLREALRLDPSDASVRIQLGSALLAQDRADEAARELEATLRVHADADAHRLLALARNAQGDRRAAAEHDRLALRLSPGMATAEADLATLIITEKDGSLGKPDEAQALAEHAVQATSEQDGHCLEVLAFVCATRGRFDEAIRSQEKARALAERLDPASLPRIEGQLQAFRSAAARDAKH
jgi:tetratricopeptide (TPR) repeat protein